jgi:hypothetical protein
MADGNAITVSSSGKKSTEKDPDAVLDRLADGHR